MSPTRKIVAFTTTRCYCPMPSQFTRRIQFSRNFWLRITNDFLKILFNIISSVKIPPPFVSVAALKLRTTKSNWLCAIKFLISQYLFSRNFFLLVDVYRILLFSVVQCIWLQTTNNAFVLIIKVHVLDEPSCCIPTSEVTFIALSDRVSNMDMKIFLDNCDRGENYLGSDHLFF